ncbi:uncharacterized protein EDB93DRAFT_1253134 [Suillus bovinus]|uniref:uncharacterized protein n=1 Tax=Suillus bovinus TaxID=48563 RepID=UPI001B861D88|nr:uncharacterized protein EDB93DRAFT_1253134 [Suillus bovinus]KAG2139203.1 hypothetical protein EDB93DRAFT_1253134 [Suillus bovinus]
MSTNLKLSSHLHAFSTNMIIISNDPTWWSAINAFRFSSYFTVAASVGMTYDWALTFGQERQRWSLMTVLYLSVRYLGIFHAVLAILSWIVYIVWSWTGVVVFAMLWVIIIIRLHAMYQQSRKILIFLIVTFLAVNIVDAVIIVMATMHTSGEELILSGTYQCSIVYVGDILVLDSVAWILTTVWEVLTLCFAVWIAVKHFRELRQHSAGGIIGDCFTVLMKTHVFYFASFAAVSCFQVIVNLSPTFLTDPNSLESQTFIGLIQILDVVQMFVLGPRLILGVREYHAKLMADSDAAPDIVSAVFQQRAIKSRPRKEPYRQTDKFCDIDRDLLRAITTGVKSATDSDGMTLPSVDTGYDSDLEDLLDNVEDGLIDAHKNDEVPEDNILQVDEDIDLGSPLLRNLISMVPVVGSHNVQVAQGNAPALKKSTVDCKIIIHAVDK